MNQSFKSWKKKSIEEILEECSKERVSVGDRKGERQ